MARANFVKKAMKDYPDSGIKKGDSYYWWKFRFSSKFRSLTRPKQSQLTQSAFMSTVLSIQERIEELSIEDVSEHMVEDFVSELQSLGEETDDSLSNMPDSLQDSPTGELLQGRVDEVENMVNELESVDCSVDIEKETDESKDEFEQRIEDRKQEILDEIQGITYNGE